MKRKSDDRSTTATAAATTTSSYRLSLNYTNFVWFCHCPFSYCSRSPSTALPTSTESKTFGGVHVIETSRRVAFYSNWNCVFCCLTVFRPVLAKNTQECMCVCVIEQTKQAEVVRRQRQRLQKETEKTNEQKLCGASGAQYECARAREIKRAPKRAAHMYWRDKRERASSAPKNVCTHTQLDTKMRRCRHAVTPRVASLPLPQRCLGICLSLSLSRSIELYNPMKSNKQLKSLYCKLQERCHGEREQERVQINQLEQRDTAKTKTVKQVQKSITMKRLRAKGGKQERACTHTCMHALRYYVHTSYWRMIVCAYTKRVLRCTVCPATAIRPRTPSTAIQRRCQHVMNTKYEPTTTLTNNFYENACCCVCRDSEGNLLRHRALVACVQRWRRRQMWRSTERSLAPPPTPLIFQRGSAEHSHEMLFRWHFL